MNEPNECPICKDLTFDDLNEETKKAIEDSANGIGLSRRFDNIDDLIADLDKDGD